MRGWLLALGIAAIQMTNASSVAADTVQEIVVEDNEKTTSDTVELIAKLEVGDEWSAEMVDLIKTRLVSSGLFKDVEVFYEPVGGGVRVHLLVRDKHSWVIAPAFYTQPTNVGGGLGFGENNLFGLDQKLLLYAQIATGDSYFVGAWVVPSIAGTRFYTQVDTYVKHARNIEYAAPTSYLSNPLAVRRSYIDYANAGLRLGYDFYKGIVKLDTRLRTARVSYGHVELATQDNPGVTAGDVGATDPANIPSPGKQGWDTSNEITLTIDRHANWYGIANGGRYTLTFERSVLNSDFHYYEVNVSAYKAWPILESHNLVLKAHLDVGHDLPFQQEFLTGGTAMRGWLNNQFRGDLRTLVNVEYSVPLFEVSGLGLRGLGFWDSAYTTFLSTANPERNYLPNSEARGLAPFKNSVGVGTRLFLRQIVLPLLGLDFGYGLEARDLQIYLAIGLTD